MFKGKFRYSDEQQMGRGMRVQVCDAAVCCYVEISQYVASIMFALIRCLIGDAGEQAAGGAQAERADKH